MLNALYHTLLYFSALGLSFEDDHAIYISVTNIDLNLENKEIYVSMKIFSDDLEDAIHNHKGDREKIVGRTDFSGVLEKIEDYIIQKIKITLDERRVVLNVTSCENLGNTTWVYLEGEIDNFSESIFIRNTVLFEIFDTQKNIIEIKNGPETHYLRLSGKEPEAIIHL